MDQLIGLAIDGITTGLVGAPLSTQLSIAKTVFEFAFNKMNEK
jgi:hypothetical protein